MLNRPIIIGKILLKFRQIWSHWQCPSFKSVRVGLLRERRNRMMGISHERTCWSLICEAISSKVFVHLPICVEKLPGRSNSLFGKRQIPLNKLFDLRSPKSELSLLPALDAAADDCSLPQMYLWTFLISLFFLDLRWYVLWRWSALKCCGNRPITLKGIN